MSNRSQTQRHRLQRPWLRRKANSVCLSLTLHVFILLLLALIASSELPTVVPIEITVPAHSALTDSALLKFSEEKLTKEDLFSKSVEELGTPVERHGTHAWSQTFSDEVLTSIAAPTDFNGSLGKLSAGFFGAKAHGQRFVYVLDISHSMSARNGGRIQRACDELLRSISELSETQEFYVLLFSFRTQEMFNDPEIGFVHAEAKQIKRLRQWLYQIELDDGTDPRRALSIAYQMKPDAVFFLSDGDFNQPIKPLADSGWIGESGVQESLNVIDGVQGHFRYLPIHAIAFENPFTYPEMQSIGRISGGTCRYVKTATFELNDDRLFRQALAKIQAVQKHGEMAELRERLRQAKHLIEAGEWVYANYIMRPLHTERHVITLRQTGESISKFLDEELDDEARRLTDEVARDVEDAFHITK